MRIAVLLRGALVALIALFSVGLQNAHADTDRGLCSTAESVTSSARLALLASTAQPARAALGGGVRAIVLANQKGAILELSGRQIGLMANADLSGLAITMR
jgi:hypothetical protein